MLQGLYARLPKAHNRRQADRGVDSEGDSEGAPRESAPLVSPFGGPRQPRQGSRQRKRYGA